MAITVSCTAFVGCSKTDDSGETSSKTDTTSSASTTEAEGAAWWTDEQKQTIDSLKQCDKEGYLFEMTYFTDYDLDELISKGTYPSSVERQNIKDLYLPDSE